MSNVRLPVCSNSLDESLDYYPQVRAIILEAEAIAAAKLILLDDKQFLDLGR